MPSLKSLAQLRTSVQARGQYENSVDMTATLIDEFLNEAGAEVWDLVIQKWEDYYVSSFSPLTKVISGGDTYTLPDDFYKLRKVEVLDGTRIVRLYPHDLTSSHLFQTTTNGLNYRYRLNNDRLTLVPKPPDSLVLRVYYIPHYTELLTDGDQLDGINGYEELVIQLALKRCKVREELDHADIDAEIERLTQRIRTAADSRDAEPFYLSPSGPPREWEDDWEEW